MLYLVCNRPNERLRSSDALATVRACRTAGLTFVNGVRGGWSMADLAAWFAGPYAQATGFAGEGLAELESESKGPSSVRSPRLEENMREASFAVKAALHEAKGPREPAFVIRAKETVAIASVRTFHGSVWVPVDLAGLSLKDRVLALFAVDFLARSKDYLFELSSCGVCGRIAFDGAGSVCEEHRQPQHLDAHLVAEQEGGPVSGARELRRSSRAPMPATSIPPSAHWVEQADGPPRRKTLSMGVQRAESIEGARRYSTLRMGTPVVASNRAEKLGWR